MARSDGSVISRWADARDELLEHLPFTVFSVAAGIVVVGLLTAVSRLVGAGIRFKLATGDRYHIFHPFHMLFSAAASTAMFWRHERRFVKAAVVGILASVLLCALSDIIMPYLAGLVLGVSMEFHVCIVSDPMLVLPFLLTGVVVGFLLPTTTHAGTWYSHSAHVFVSSMASILYLVRFGLTDWVDKAGLVLVLMVLAVMVPCCASDLVLPVLAARHGIAARGAKSETGDREGESF